MDCDSLDLSMLTAQQADNEMLLDFGEWLEATLPTLRMGISELFPGACDDDKPAAHYYAPHRDGGTQYAIFMTLARRLTQDAEAIRQVASTHPDWLVVVASPDCLSAEDRELLPRAVPTWDALYWFRNRWRYIQSSIGASNWRPALARIHAEVARALRSRIDALPPGRELARDKQYEALIGALFLFLFYPALQWPMPQATTSDGAHRRDWIYHNHDDEGPWGWLVRNNLHAPSITVEAKNNEKPIGISELDDLVRYLGPDRAGSVGVLACRHKPQATSPVVRHLTTLAARGILILIFNDKIFLELILARGAGDIGAVDDCVFRAIHEIRSRL
jgi:hypothetical protein